MDGSERRGLERGAVGDQLIQRAGRRPLAPALCGGGEGNPGAGQDRGGESGEFRQHFGAGFGRASVGERFEFAAGVVPLAAGAEPVARRLGAGDFAAGGAAGGECDAGGQVAGRAAHRREFDRPDCRLAGEQRGWGFGVVGERFAERGHELGEAVFGRAGGVEGHQFGGRVRGEAEFGVFRVGGGVGGAGHGEFHSLERGLT